MTFMLSASPLAALKRQAPILRLPSHTKCTILLALAEQPIYRTVMVQHHRYTSRKLKSPASASIPSTPTYTVASTSTAIPDEVEPYKFIDKINPPRTTLPAPLTVPERRSDQGTIKYYISVGRSYWAFYKAGVKNVWRNAKERQRLVRRKRTDKKLPPPAMLDTKENAVLDERALGQYANYPFTRAEFQFFTRSWRDAKRIPVFIILLAIFGEYLPLVVIFCTPLVPYTCRIPKQIRTAREQLEERRSQSFRGQMGDVPTPLKAGTEREVRSLDQLDAAQINHIARSLGLYFNFWDRLGAFWPPSFILRRKVNKRLQYLEIDDALFRRDGGVEQLKGDEEIRLAAEERGIDILNRGTDEIHKLVCSWSKGAEQGRTLAMLLSRPAVWASKQTSKP